MPTDIEQFLRLLFGIWVTANNNSEIKDLKKIKEFDKSDSGYYIDYEKLIEKLHKPKKDEAEELITLPITDSHSLQLSLSLEKDNKSYLVIKLEDNIYIAITVCQELSNNVLKITGKDFSNNREKDGLKTKYLIKLLESIGGFLLNTEDKVNRFRRYLINPENAKKITKQEEAPNGQNQYFIFTFKLINQLTNDQEIEENINYYKSVLGDNINTTNNYPEVKSPNKRIYIERPNIQKKCYRNINNGDSFRIKGSKGMGKTELLKHLINYAHNQQYLTISIDFSSAPDEIFNDLRVFHNWVFNQIILGLFPNNEFATYDQNYDNNYDPNTNASSYLMKVLNQIQNRRLLLALDNADRLFTSTIRDDVGGLWRSWCDNGIGNQEIRQNMMMIIAHATDKYPDYNINQSPFQGIPSITLLDWDQYKIREIATQQYNLTITDTDIQILMSLIGGHPRLIEIAMEYLHYEDSNINYLVNEIATTDESPFRDYLDEILRHLEKLPTLRDVYQRISSGYAQLEGINLSSVDKYHLQAMGLIRYENGIPIPKYQIYQEYFKNRLNGETI